MTDEEELIKYKETILLFYITNNTIDNINNLFKKLPKNDHILDSGCCSFNCSFEYKNDDDDNNNNNNNKYQEICIHTTYNYDFNNISSKWKNHYLEWQKIAKRHQDLILPDDNNINISIMKLNPTVSFGLNTLLSNNNNNNNYNYKLYYTNVNNNNAICLDSKKCKYYIYLQTILEKYQDKFEMAEIASITNNININKTKQMYYIHQFLFILNGLKKHGNLYIEVDQWNIYDLWFQQCFYLFTYLFTTISFQTFKSKLFIVLYDYNYNSYYKQIVTSLLVRVLHEHLKSPEDCVYDMISYESIPKSFWTQLKSIFDKYIEWNNNYINIWKPQIILEYNEYKQLNLPLSLFKF